MGTATSQYVYNPLTGGVIKTPYSFNPSGNGTSSYSFNPGSGSGGSIGNIVPNIATNLTTKSIGGTVNAYVNAIGGSGNPGGSGGGGGGGINNQLAIDNTVAGAKTMADRIYESYEKNLNTLKDMDEANTKIANSQRRDTEVMFDTNWQEMMSKLQSSMQHMWNTMGTGRAGSMLGDTVSLAKRYKDSADSNLKTTFTNDMNNITRTLYGELMDSWQQKRAMLSDAIPSMTDLETSLAANVSNIDQNAGKKYYANGKLNTSGDALKYFEDILKKMRGMVPTMWDEGFPQLTGLYGYVNPDGPATPAVSGGSTVGSMGSANPEWLKAISHGGYENRDEKGY